jgi:Na+/H+ antiporter NhaB
MTGGVLDDTADDTADEIVDETVEISDEELAALALAADPFAPIDDDAVPFGNDPARFPLLPEWYMPAPGIRRSRGRAVIMLALAASLVIINIGGFCVTYGFPEFVWHSP